MAQTLRHRLIFLAIRNERRLPAPCVVDQQFGIDAKEPVAEQLDLFTNYETLDKERKSEENELQRELKIQKALINIQDKYGKNAIVKGLNMKKESTAMKRNKQIGGHNA